MSQLLAVSGTDLRYLLTAYLFDHGPATVEELVDALAYHGCTAVAALHDPVAALAVGGDASLSA
jgi:hypothetical protein